MTRAASVVLLTVTCVSLAACNDEPSAAAMQQAMADSFARLTPPEIAVANLQFGGKRDGHLDDPPDVANLRKVGCAPAAPREGHVCEFSVTINGIERPGIKARFVRAADRKLAIDD